MIVENKTSGSNKNEAINALSSKIAFNKFFSNTQTDVRSQKGKLTWYAVSRIRGGGNVLTQGAKRQEKILTHSSSVGVHLSNFFCEFKHLTKKPYFQELVEKSSFVYYYVKMPLPDVPCSGALK